MGIVNPGVPRDFVAFLREVGGYAEFVETGTFLGASTLWAAAHFARVQTVEASRELFARAREVLEPHANVVRHLGRSQDVLRAIVPGLKEPALFWLDAHWSAGETFGEREECPLLLELEIILAGGSHAVLIDDARLFLRCPPRPHDWRQWPRIDRICAAVSEHSRGSAFVTVVDDVIYCLPRSIEEAWCEHLSARLPAPLPTRPRWMRRLARWLEEGTPAPPAD